MLFSALVMRYVSEKSSSNKCEKAGVINAYNIISDFPAIKTANDCKSLLTIKITESKENKSS